MTFGRTPVVAAAAVTVVLTALPISVRAQGALEDHFRGKGYAALKQELADVCIEFLKPIQERIHGIDDDKLNQILEQGAERAEGIARMTLNQVKTNMGIIGARN